MSRNKKIVFLWIAFQLLASALFADPLTGCITDFGGERYYTFFQPTHVEKGIWTQHSGCEASGPEARPTEGPMKVEYFGEGELITLDFCEFEANKSSQVDLRQPWANSYWDFILDKGDQPEWCSNSGDEVEASTDDGGIIHYTPRRRHHRRPPPPVCPECGIDQHSNPTPVPEPASMILMGSGLLYVMRRRRGKT
jgi:hypothetical protein